MPMAFWISTSNVECTPRGAALVAAFGFMMLVGLVLPNSKPDFRSGLRHHSRDRGSRGKLGPRRPPDPTPGFGPAPRLNGPPVHVTQTGVGIYELRRAGKCLSARWFQDEERQLLRVDEGFPMEDGWAQAGQISCISANGSVIVTAGRGGEGREVLHCEFLPNFTYAQELTAYSGEHLDWTHNATINAERVMAFSGPAPDAVGTIPVTVYADELAPHLFRGWDAVGGGGGAGVSRHWFYLSQLRSVFAALPDVADCNKFCGLTPEEATLALRKEGAPGLTVRYQYCPDDDAPD